MKLKIFEKTDMDVLQAKWSHENGKKDKEFEDFTHKYGMDIMALLTSENTKEWNVLSTLDILAVDLDYAATLYCDVWLEGAGLHGQLYTGQYETPIVAQTETHHDLPGYRYSTHKNYSGNASGVIGESLF